MADSSLQVLARMLLSARRAVFFGGAGVSTESGIPDFRSTDGLYNQQWKYPPEVILSHTFFQSQTEEFYRFYRQKMLFPKARPNGAHRALAALEQRGILSAVITQNIDGLHQAAGSRKVIELHGSVHRNHCVRCRRFYSLEDVLATSGIPRCSCGGLIKPDVVLYEEQLPAQAIEEAVTAIARADLLIIGGTSLQVGSAAGLARQFSGGRLVIINKSKTLMDGEADLVFHDSIGKVLTEVDALR